MSQMTVLVFDQDPLQREYFVSSFQEENIPVLEAATSDDLFEIIDENEGQFALLDYASLVSEKRETIVALFKALKNQLSVVFNVPLDATKRIVFYELGALRVYDQGTSIEEVYRNVKWWMKVSQEGKKEAPPDLQGTLASVDFMKLLWGIGGSGKSGILKIETPRNMGELFFKNGQLIAAKVLNHSGLDAFFHVTLWNEGQFAFRQTATDEIVPTIHLTLAGLLILAQNLKLEINPILREFKSDSSVLQAVNLGDLPLYELTVNEAFLEYISIPRELSEVLENPYYPNHETLRILSKLKHFGLLRINEPLGTIIEQEIALADGVHIDRQTVSEIAGDLKKVEVLSEILGLQENEPAKIVVIAQDSEILKHYLNTLAGAPSKVFLENNMYFVRLRLAETLEMILIGLHADHRLLRSLSTLSENIHGFVFLFDARNTGQKEYLSYLINQVLAQYPRPSVAAATYLAETQSPESLQQEYSITLPIPWRTYSPNSQSDMLDLILDLQPVPSSEAEAKEESEADE